MRRRRGGQPRNRNAFKHGFYSRFLSQEETLALQQADSLQGLDSEIAILRLKISQLLDHDPGNLHLILSASAILARLLRVKYQLNPQQAKGLQQAVAGVLREVALPLGLNLSHRSRRWRSHRQKNLPFFPSKVESSPEEKERGQA